MKKVWSQRIGLMLQGFLIGKLIAFECASKDFEMKWNEMLYNAKKNLAGHLLHKSSKWIGKTLNWEWRIWMMNWFNPLSKQVWAKAFENTK